MSIKFIPSINISYHLSKIEINILIAKMPQMPTITGFYYTPTSTTLPATLK